MLAGLSRWAIRSIPPCCCAAALAGASNSRSDTADAVARRDDSFIRHSPDFRVETRLSTTLDGRRNRGSSAAGAMGSRSGGLPALSRRNLLFLRSSRRVFRRRLSHLTPLPGMLAADAAPAAKPRPLDPCEPLPPARLARCRASRRRSSDLTDSGRSAWAMATGLPAPKQTSVVTMTIGEARSKVDICSGTKNPTSNAQEPALVGRLALEQRH